MVKSQLILDYINSIDLRPYSESFDSPAALAAWFAERDLLDRGGRVTTNDLREAIELREALRTLLGAHNGFDGDLAAASEVVDRVARRADVCVRFRDGLMRLEPEAAGVRGALGAVVAEVAAAMTDGTWERMKICRADDCRWAFLDTARNQSRAWCSMSSCGNREKMRAYRARQGHGSNGH
jgi:predicted RNA-binding Zn ribbon-like protein